MGGEVSTKSADEVGKDGGRPTAAGKDAGEARVEYYQAREDARRHNRNLLQFAGGIAAVTGISSGSGGILYVANALATDNAGGNEVVNSDVFGWILGIATCAVVVLAVGLVVAYRKRGAAEANAAQHLGALMRSDPDFTPAE